MMHTHLTKRNGLWALALVVTLWLTWQTHQEEQAGSESTIEAASLLPIKYSVSTSAQPSTAQEDFSLTPRETGADDNINLFTTPQKATEVRAKVAQGKPLKPIAPPLPFTFIGMLQEQGINKLIVNYSDDVAVLKVGDMLGGYQLTSANKIGGSMQFQFLYMPMKITQTMVVNDAN